MNPVPCFRDNPAGSQMVPAVSYSVQVDHGTSREQRENPDREARCPKRSRWPISMQRLIPKCSASGRIFSGTYSRFSNAIRCGSTPSRTSFSSDSAMRSIHASGSVSVRWSAFELSQCRMKTVGLRGEVPWINRGPSVENDHATRGLHRPGTRPKADEHYRPGRTLRPELSSLRSRPVREGYVRPPIRTIRVRLRQRRVYEKADVRQNERLGNDV